MGNFDTTSSLAIILLAALIHASFQVSVSVLTLLHSHSLGKKTAHTRLLRLTGGFIAGAGTMSLLFLCSLSFVLANVFVSSTPAGVWAVCCGAVVGVGASVWLFYFRESKGTSLWLPRGLARFLNARTKQTTHSAEAYSLGLTSVVSEIIFIFAPLLIAALVLIRLDPLWQLVGTLTYVTVSLLPLLVIGVLIGGGHTVARIQRWRESNKRFLQFSAASSLFILGVYVYVERVVVASAVAAGVQ